MQHSIVFFVAPFLDTFDIDPYREWGAGQRMSKVYKLPWAPKTMKNRGFGQLKTKLFTIKNI